MSIGTIKQIITFALQSFWRNFWLSIVTISIIALALISINSLVIINAIADTAITNLKDKVDVSVYFKREATDAQVLEVKTFLSTITQVKEIDHITQQEAYIKFRQLHQSDPVIIESLEELDSNPLSATLVISAHEIQDYPTIIDILTNSKYNDLILDKNFDDNEVLITKIKQVSDNINRIGLITALIFVIIAMVIVFNTIQVTIYTHKKEIAIMKLVGASNWFIRSPFLLESVLYGLSAWLISLIVLYPLVNFMQPYLDSYLFVDSFNVIGYLNSNFIGIFGTELLLITLLNCLSSAFAVRRYINV